MKLWHDGNFTPSSVQFHVGDTIGLAANLELGKIALSINGSDTLTRRCVPMPGRAATLIRQCTSAATRDWQPTALATLLLHLHSHSYSTCAYMRCTSVWQGLGGGHVWRAH